nr:GGDEF domain-containing protein [Anaerotalea alkaliphila]
MAGVALLLVASFVFINFVILRQAVKILLKSEKSKDLYKERAHKDALTGVHTRRFFERWTEKQMRKETLEEAVTLVMIDIDGFKVVNDTQGHLAGDRLLKEVADVLVPSLREGDLVIRYGGDEFLLILHNCSGRNSHTILERISNRLEGAEEGRAPVSISYGIQEVRQPKDIHHALRAADEKMYAVKKSKKRKGRASHV